MEFGIALPTAADSWKLAKRAEELGFSHAWFYDTQMLSADCFVAMGAAAVNTKRIRLGTGVLVPSNRIAPVTANALASLNSLAPGRIDFGIGTGFTARRAMGFGAIKIKDMETYIHQVYGLLAGKTVDFEMEGQSRKIRFLNPELDLFNTRDPIALHLSAFGPRTRALTARLKAGWIDFVGSVDGVEFEGGTGKDFNLTLGSGQFIPGFEDQLIGAKGGDKVDVKVQFPTDYHAANLASKDAVFAVTMKNVQSPEASPIDDALAQKLGLDNVATLRERVRDQIRNDYNQATRMHLKRRILDALDKVHEFPLPPAMVEVEFNAIWAQVEAELAREGKTAADDGKTDDELKTEYRKIAERRVRLGLVLGKLGEQNGITITSDEVNHAITARARQYPGQEQQVFQYYAQNPQAQAEIRAPLFEDKVVDFIAELAQVTEKKVAKDVLFADPEDEAV